MSHILSIQVQIKEEKFIEKACKRLNWEMIAGVADSITISPPNSYRAINLWKKGKDNYRASLDAYDQPLLDKLTQAYSAEIVRSRLEESAHSQGLDIWEIRESVDERGYLVLSLEEG